jgi:RNA polymerase sigma factor (sigma-70 family)
MSIPLRIPSPSVPGHSPDDVQHLRPVADSPADPAILSALLTASTGAGQERAWERFLQVYSELLLRSARAAGAGYDGAMDRYAYVLDQLRADDFRRLRQFRETASARFTTWLVVVARRLCLDHIRRRYGRRGGREGAVTWQSRIVRRRLADLVAEGVEVTDLVDSLVPDPAALLAQDERRRLLASALSGIDPRSLLLLRLRFVQGLTAREIAQLMGYPSPFHVFRSLNAVLARMRRKLLEAGIDGSSG